MATKQRSQPTVHITEDLASSKIRKVDATRGVIEGVKLIGTLSKNGRVYPPSVLKSAVQLYEGVKVNVDHPVSGNPASPRQYRDRIGVMKNARVVENSGIYADFHYNPKHALADQLAWDAENNPESLGFSHNALTRMAGRDSQGREIVEQIVSVRHVDLVADPATTRGLFESEIPMDDQSMNTQPAAGSSDPLEIIIDSIAAQIGEIAKAEGDPKTKMKQIADLLKKQDKIMTLLGSKPAGDEGKPAEEHTLLISKVTTLTQQLEQYQAKERLATLKATIEQELAAAGLAKDNPVHVSELFMKQLLTTEAVTDRAALIKDRASLVGAAGKAPQFQPPQSQGTYKPTMEQSNDPNYWMQRLLS
jgi:hypothetical protein